MIFIKELEEKLASRHEVASPQPSTQPLSNGVEVPQELAQENSQLKEEVSVLKKKVEDFKKSNTVRNALQFIIYLFIHCFYTVLFIIALEFLRYPYCRNCLKV